jgi:homoserine dehydrogenase
VAVRDPGRSRAVDLPPDRLTTSPEAVVDDPAVEIVVADILNIAGIRQVGGNATGAGLDPLLAASSWRRCRLVESSRTRHRNYVRLRTRDEPGVIGRIGSCFGNAGVSIRSIVQFEAQAGAAEEENPPGR